MVTLKKIKKNGGIKKPATVTGGFRMAETEKVHTQAERFSAQAEKVQEQISNGFTAIRERIRQTPEQVKKVAAWYIDTNEKLANEAIKMQQTATGWAKDTPLAPVFEAQQEFSKRFVQRSAEVARRIWQIS